MDQAVTVRKLLAETFLLSKMQTLTAAACRAGHAKRRPATWASEGFFQGGTMGIFPKFF